MEIVKKNLISIICGVIALAAAVTAFFPLGGFWTDLHDRAQARTGAFSEAKGLATKDRALPVVTPDGEAQKLLLSGQPVFPNNNIIEAAKAQLGVVKENSDRFLAQAVQASERKPLVDNVLPGTSANPAAETEFRRRYNAAMDTTAANLARTPSSENLGRILHASAPPTADDVNRESAVVRKDVEDSMLQKGSNGQILNQPAVDLEIQARTATLFDDLKRKSAEKGMVYVNPDGSSFTIDPNFMPSAAATLTGPSAVFWAQVNYWVQEEFCRAVFDVNSHAMAADGTPAKNVLDAPIKHILSVRVTPGFSGVTLQNQQQADPGALPAAGIPFDRAEALTKDRLISMTGRKSGGIIDVVLYDVEMAVEVERLPYVLERIGQNRYLSIALVRNITPIDSSIQKSQGYLYGDKPCVRVSMQMEQVFMREWMLKYMPAQIMKLLNVAPPISAGGVAAPMPGMPPQ